MDELISSSSIHGKCFLLIYLLHGLFSRIFKILFQESVLRYFKYDHAVITYFDLLHEEYLMGPVTL